jgi:hypothetical protein
MRDPDAAIAIVGIGCDVRAASAGAGDRAGAALIALRIRIDRLGAERRAIQQAGRAVTLDGGDPRLALIAAAVAHVTQ